MARGACVVKGGMHGEGGHVWQRGAVHGEGGMCGKGRGGACMAKGGMCGEGGACVVCTASHCTGAMHPTGMHSCLLAALALIIGYSIYLYIHIANSVGLYSTPCHAYA